ncbi:phosphate ABC transporter substrate-binding protein [Alteromonas sp. KC3]|uniref:phosphate/phosphite/phosphonate ABC transporter substrate-binding protein n=1 Tax=unclassified Alteromonas TaxID=2614992 RepID=UPI0019223DC5|nr:MULTISPECIES: phosphate/phosphite/phosphonate ABC transporter substrate-binding protein [unclassified Alteromonas]BCO20621.1 phosphate ABC transporter substrate-binding protein [Alteromonas sp. KC3]BCO24590.1 phosphate ABC transporter substrate-binding protein [Alteromonas sp. KC14]
MRNAFIVVLIALLYGTASTPVCAQGKTLTFGVVPQQSPKRMVEIWQPLIDYISEYSGISIMFKTAKDIPSFEADVADGVYDIAYMNPYHFVTFNDLVGYHALARQRDKEIKGIIVVHKDSPIQNLAELNGRELAFPAPAAFAATIITSAQLRKNNIAFRPRYVNSHDSVYLAVQRGFFEAGGGILRTLSSIPESVSKDIRVLWESDGYTPHAIATHPNMAQKDRQAILNALIAITNDSSKMWILEGLGFSGFIPAKDSDWDDVRSLGIPSLSRPHF